MIERRRGIIGLPSGFKGEPTRDPTKYGFNRKEIGEIHRDLEELREADAADRETVIVLSRIK